MWLIIASAAVGITISVGQVTRRSGSASADESILVSGFLRGYGFLTLPAKFAGPATPHRQLKRYLEALPTRVGGPEAVVHRPRYYVATATFWAMIIMHHTLLRIALNDESS